MESSDLRAERRIVTRLKTRSRLTVVRNKKNVTVHLGLIWTPGRGCRDGGGSSRTDLLPTDSHVRRRLLQRSSSTDVCLPTLRSALDGFQHICHFKACKTSVPNVFLISPFYIVLSIFANRLNYKHFPNQRAPEPRRDVAGQGINLF